MKNYIILFFLLFLSLKIDGQTQRFIYEYSFKPDSLNKENVIKEIGGEIKLNINPNNGNISASPGTTIKKPSDFMVKMYGVVKRNGVWHGSKIDNTRQ